MKMDKRLFKINLREKESSNGFILLLILILLKILVSSPQLRNNYIIRSSEINLVIKGSGKQSLIYSNFNVVLSQVLVNGKERTDCKKICYLEQEINNVTLIFDTEIDSCYEMFYSLMNIIEIDLSKFDASHITDMSYMFNSSSNLEKINFGNINTSSLKSMKCLFQYCYKLTSIDLSHFDTSHVTDMRWMFFQCYDLIKVNFGNINTSSLQSMYALFGYCSKLEFVNLSKFDTSLVTDMSNMFFECSNLIYLDLSNFNTKNVDTTKRMFHKCRSLIFLNLYSFKVYSPVKTDNIFSSISSYVKYCIVDTETVEYILSPNNKEASCSDICFQENIKIDKINKECLKSCSINGYYYECNNICYNSCPSDAYPIYGYINKDDKEVTICYDIIPEGYYLDSTDKTYKKCYETCKFCYGQGTKDKNNCKECISDFIFLDESLYPTNCYKKCSYYYYFDESNNFYCTENEICPTKFNKIIRLKKKCIDNCQKDDIYKYEYDNECFKKCPDETIITNNFFCNKEEKDEDIISYLETEQKKQETSTLNSEQNKENKIDLYDIIYLENQTEVYQNIKKKINKWILY